MYTFYFQALEQNWQYKLVALKGPSEPFDLDLGKIYPINRLDYILDLGHRVVIQPKNSTVTDLPNRMFYAKGYRGPKIKTWSEEYAEAVKKYFENNPGWANTPNDKIAQNANSAAWTELGDDIVPTHEYAETETCPVTDLPLSECKDRFPSFHRPEDEQDFIDYANGSQPNWCGEDLGQDPLNADSLERESYIRGDAQPLIAEVAEVAQSAKPAIGPLPPQAPLSGYAWALQPSITVPLGTMLNPAEKELMDVTFSEKGFLGLMSQAVPEEPSWWELVKNWIKKDF